MPRRLRIDRGGYVYHVLNRRAGGLPLFEKDEDYAAFEKVLLQAEDQVPMRVLAYGLMPNHWHLVLWPRRDGQLSRYMHWVTVTHMRRWHAHRGTIGTGPVYQGRFRSFPVQEDHHLLLVCRYAERNASRAGLVQRMKDWPWSSLAARRRKDAGFPRFLGMDEWPVAPPRNWVAFANRAETDAELWALRRSVIRGAPFGDEGWQERTAARLQLQSSLRPPWRPGRHHAPDRK